MNSSSGIDGGKFARKRCRAGDSFLTFRLSEGVLFIDRKHVDIAVASTPFCKSHCMWSHLFSDPFRTVDKSS